LVLDISQGGVRLVTHDRLEEGEEVVVSLLPPSCTREYHLPARVAWCLDVADGSHVVGIRFDRRLSDAEVLYLARHPGA
jgi:Tfp pilus assembly protein PilZ